MVQLKDKMNSYNEKQIAILFGNQGKVGMLRFGREVL